MRFHASALRQPLVRCLAAALALVPLWAEAQLTKRGVPSSLPPVLTSESVHSTASTSVVPYADNPRDSLAWLTSKPYDPLYKEAPNACKADSLICYDYRKRHSVVPMTKSLMPEVPGLKREGVTMKRDKVAFNYSF